MEMMRAEIRAMEKCAFWCGGIVGLLVGLVIGLLA
jgi:hypothetical protein